MKCGEDFYATTETNYMRKINPQTLETLEKVPVNLLQPASVPGSWEGPSGLGHWAAGTHGGSLSSNAIGSWASPAQHLALDSKLPWRLCHFISVSVFVLRATETKYQKVGRLEQQRFTLSHFWRLEIWNRGVLRAMLSLKAPGKDAGLPLPASGGCQESSVFLGL